MEATSYRVGYSVSAGRSGTRFLAQVIGRVAGVAACHERSPLPDTFHRYCTWYDLPVDDLAFRQMKREQAQEDLKRHRYSFEASPHLSFSLGQLAAATASWRPRFVHQVRRPDKVVNSYYSKGLFKHGIPIANWSLVPGLDSRLHPHQSFGRIMPNSQEELARWMSQTRIGKIAWFWRAVTQRIIDDSETHNLDMCLVRLEALDYDDFVRVCQHLQLGDAIGRAQFQAIARRRPNRLGQTRDIDTWSLKERREFEEMVKPVAEALGYEWRTDRLLRS